VYPFAQRSFAFPCHSKFGLDDDDSENGKANKAAVIHHFEILLKNNYPDARSIEKDPDKSIKVYDEIYNSMNQKTKDYTFWQNSWFGTIPSITGTKKEATLIPGMPTDAKWDWKRGGWTSKSRLEIYRWGLNENGEKVKKVGKLKLRKRRR